MDRMTADRIIIDGERIGSREDLFDALRLQLGEDRLIGSNLDALHDALTSITCHTVIEIRCRDRLAQTLGDYGKKVMWVLSDCLDENRDLVLEIIDK